MRGLRHRLLFCLLAAACVVLSGAEPEPLRVATYNLRNYLAMDRLVEGTFRRDYPKPEAEKAVARRTVVDAAPDILAVQEIGSKAQLVELRDDLERDGLTFESLYVLEADDDTRRIGALWNSRARITPQAHDDLGFELFGERLLVKRGLLELKVVPEQGVEDFSIFVLHLKSKYTSDSRDPQSTLRRTKEAHAVRERILERFPNPAQSRFLIVGDLNDNRNSSPVRRLLVRGDLTISRILEAKDRSGLIWTHYYAKGGEYSLLDYMLASDGLLRSCGATSAILDRADYYEGSDHRLVWTDLRPRP